MTQSTLAAMLLIARIKRIRDIERKAIRKLRHASRSNAVTLVVRGGGYEPCFDSSCPGMWGTIHSDSCINRRKQHLADQ